MTLVVYVPYREGAILISDKQDTFPDTRRSVEKLFLRGSIGPAMGGAGSTDLIHTLDTHLCGTNSFTDDNIISASQSYLLTKYSELRLADVNTINDIQLLILINSQNNVAVHEVTAVFNRSLPATRCHAIGSGEMFVRPQLQLDTTNLSKVQAKEFGFVLIKYASTIDTHVGSPEEFGCDIVFVDSGGTFTLTFEKPKHVSLKQLLYNFDESSGVEYYES